MPRLGEVKVTKNSHRTHKYIWHACEDCGKEKWVRLEKGVARSKRCFTCSGSDPQRKKQISLANLGDKHYGWKGGRHLNQDGYVMIYLPSGDFFLPMAGCGARHQYVTEHRLVMARHLNRCLLPWEIVHHKNGVRDDNRLENLVLIKGNHNHAPFNLLQREINKLRAQIKKLEIIKLGVSTCAECRYFFHGYAIDPTRNPEIDRPEARWCLLRLQADQMNGKCPVGIKADAS